MDWKFNIQFGKIVADFYANFLGLSGAKVCWSCRSWKKLQNAPTLAIVAVDTAKNGPSEIWQNLPKSAKIWQNLAKSGKIGLEPQYSAPRRIRRRAAARSPAQKTFPMLLIITSHYITSHRFCQISDGPFSAVSTATIARIGAFCSFFQDLLD